jgi:5-formyltetrahydrofolate cyclo-ligase
MSSKDEIREIAQSRIHSLSPQEKRDLSRELCRKVKESGLFDGADALYAFCPFRGEIDVVPLLEAVLIRNIPLFLPRIQGKEMFFYRALSLSEVALPRNRWGIREPAGEGAPSRPEEYARPLMLLPGLAFTRQGHRLGRGGGYYDRYLSRNEEVTTAGVAYPVQIFDELPLEPHDRILDRVFY